MKKFSLSLRIVGGSAYPSNVEGWIILTAANLKFVTEVVQLLYIGFSSSW